MSVNVKGEFRLVGRDKDGEITFDTGCLPNNITKSGMQLLLMGFAGDQISTGKITGGTDYMNTTCASGGYACYVSLASADTSLTYNSTSSSKELGASFITTPRRALNAVNFETTLEMASDATVVSKLTMKAKYNAGDITNNPILGHLLLCHNPAPDTTPTGDLLAFRNVDTGQALTDAQSYEVWYYLYIRQQVNS